METGMPSSKNRSFLLVHLKIGFWHWLPGIRKPPAWGLLEHHERKYKSFLWFMFDWDHQAFEHPFAHTNGQGPAKTLTSRLPEWGQILGVSDHSWKRHFHLLAGTALLLRATEMMLK
jgi:hypothetical protein